MKTITYWQPSHRQLPTRDIIFYGSKPEPGNEYKIEISHPKYKSISAVETVPQAINFNVEKFKIVDSSTYYDYWLQKSVGTLKASVNIRLSDPKGEKNYYRFICYYYDSIYGGVINQVWLESETFRSRKNIPMACFSAINTLTGTAMK
jgi:hypothetical protein